MLEVTGVMALAAASVLDFDAAHHHKALNHQAFGGLRGRHGLVFYPTQKGREPAPLLIAEGNKRLLASFHDQTGDDEWMVVLREENDASAVESLIAAFRLTQREAEVLYWVVQGKTSNDIGEILGNSPRTVNKHLEHVFEKLGVETRTAAANLAMSKMRGS